jgi:hypothetical protein
MVDIVGLTGAESSGCVSWSPGDVMLWQAAAKCHLLDHRALATIERWYRHWS